jgi:E3 ubiquitin-protein ligase makorin
VSCVKGGRVAWAPKAHQTHQSPSSPFHLLPLARSLECIREWRGRIDLPVETTRSCPVCRQLSYLVIPCDRFIADEGRKAVVSREYHDAQRAIPCRHFNYGKGTCPFGSSCFYAHTNPDGTPAVQPKHVVRGGADGNVGVTRAFKLNEFLFR